MSSSDSCWNPVQYLGTLGHFHQIMVCYWGGGHPPSMKELRDVLIQDVDLMFQHLWDQSIHCHQQFTSRRNPDLQSLQQKRFWSACHWYCLVVFTGFEAQNERLDSSSLERLQQSVRKVCSDTCTNPTSMSLQSPWLYTTLRPSHRKMKLMVVYMVVYAKQ